MSVLSRTVDLPHAGATEIVHDLLAGGTYGIVPPSAFGLSRRKFRQWKRALDREAGLFEQEIVMPWLKAVRGTIQ